MFTLHNDQLRVEILDPAADQQRMGARYCTAGYIWQIHDREKGALLSGPTYPDGFNTFDGQGIPDAFNLQPLRRVGEPTEAYVLGVGVVELKPQYQKNEVKLFCEWSVNQLLDHSVQFFTQVRYADWSALLTRTVTLENRTIRSHTHIQNWGEAALPICWFPHPFYPQFGAGQDELIKLNIAVEVEMQPSYLLNENGFIARQGWAWQDGNYLALNHNANAPLVVQQRHPKLGIVVATTSYTPSFFPIWGNPNTFSWEPFLERTLAPNQQLAWWVDYDF